MLSPDQSKPTNKRILTHLPIRAAINSVSHLSNMATTSSIIPQKLTFGVEIELLLKPKGTVYVSNILKKYGFQSAIQPTLGDTNHAAKATNRDAIRKGVVDMLIDRDMQAGLESAHFDIWTVKEEGSLTEVPDASGGGYCKLLSPSFLTEDPGSLCLTPAL